MDYKCSISQRETCPELRSLAKKNIEIQERYRESEQRYNSIFTSNHLVMMIIDPETGRIVNANPAACQFYGYRCEELEQLKITDINIDKNENVHKYMAWAANEQKNCFYFTHKLANGELRDVEVYSGPIKIDGRVLIYSIIHDITERRIAMEQIRTAYLELDQIFQAAGEGMRVIDNKYNIIRVNERFLKMIGKPKEEVLGKKCFEVFPGIDCHTPQCCLKRINAGVKYIESEVEKEIGNQVKSPFILTTTPYLYQGELVGVVQSFKDISERKLVEETLRQSETRYRRLFELLPDAVVVYSEGRIISLNTMAANIFGATFYDELIGKDIMSLFHPDYRGKAQKRMKEAIERGRTNGLNNYKFVRVDGTVFEGEATSSSFNYRGKPAIQTVIRDISERKRELDMAAKIQQSRLDARSPLPDRIDLEVIYLPARTISGDLYHLYKANDHTVVGLIGDVTGKGMSAALSTSAMKVLFYEVASRTSDPLSILNQLNLEVAKYLEEEYVAACCFKLDFLTNKFYIVGAGINIFFFYHNDFYCWHETVKGPSLGMLPNSVFDQKVLDFNSGDKFYFYTDGVTDYLENEQILNDFKELPTIREQKDYLEQVFQREIYIKDDITMLALEIK